VHRREWKQRGEILASATFQLHGSRLLPSQVTASAAAFNNYQSRLLVAGAFQPHGAATIEYLGQGEPTSMQASAAVVWRLAPPEKSVEHFRAFKPVSIAVQRTLRRVLLERWLNDPANCERYDETMAVLAYAHSAPFPGKPRNEFAYDILKRCWMKPAFFFTRKPLEASLSNLSDSLESIGRSDLACIYREKPSKEVLRRVRKQPRSIECILGAEERVINHIVLLGSLMRADSGSREIATAAGRWMAALEVRLRTVSRGIDLTDVGSLLLIEATRALSSFELPEESNVIVFRVPDKHAVRAIDEHTVRSRKPAPERIAFRPIAA